MSVNGTIAPPSPFPVRRKQSLKIDAEIVVDSVLRRAEQIEGDQNRSQWLDARLQRYAKYRGWLPMKTFPWAGCSNVHIPVLQIAELRANAGLHNTVMTLRPLMAAKATNRGGIAKEDRITELIDAQLFLDPGPEQAERRFGDFISCFLQDGNAVAYTPWVREKGMARLVKYVPPIPDGMAPGDYIGQLFTGKDGLFPSDATIELDAKLDYRFHITYQGARQREETATVSVYSDRDGGLELMIEKPCTQYDGPVFLPLSASSLLVPTRCTNLQPPAEWNPDGAPYVFMLWHYRIDEIRRLKESGTFNWLDAEGLEKIIAAAKGQAGVAVLSVNEELETQKDQIEGRDHRQASGQYEEDIGHISVPFMIAFDRWDVDGDGLSEDCFFVIARDSKVLCEARLLTDRWPAERPYRPLAESAAITVPGRWYAIGLLELGEALADLIKGTFDQSFDSWSFANLPSGFFAASSKLNADVISWSPGQLYPVPGNPRETIYFPTLPQHDQSTALGIIGLAFQFFERQMAMGALQSGQVPTGKASALRTYGTTAAILQQGDVRADQLLIRLFGGLRQVARNFHRMNRHLLPEGKEIRILGYDGPKEQAYTTVTPGDVDADMDFDFRPDFLNSNPAMLGQALERMLGIIGTPLAFQLNITDAQLFYRAIRDYARSLRLDYKLYMKQPQDTGEPGYFAEEAIDLIMQHQSIHGLPAEGAELHLKKLFAFHTSEAFGVLDPVQVGLFRAWAETVGRQVQQAKMVQAAQQFQGAMQAGPGGQGGTVNSPMQEPQMAQQQAQPQGPAELTGAGQINA